MPVKAYNTEQAIKDAERAARNYPQRLVDAIAQRDRFREERMTAWQPEAVAMASAKEKIWQHQIKVITSKLEESITKYQKP